MAVFFAKKCHCTSGHKHDSKAEAARCDVLHVRQSTGEIVGLRVQPFFAFNIDGRPLKMSNGHHSGYTADFTYVEAHQQVVEDVKPKNGGGRFGQSRDFPLRFALAKALYPTVAFKVVK